MFKTNAISFLLFFITSFCSTMCFGQTNDLIGYYAFDGDAIDSSDYQNHGAIIDAVLTNDLNGNPENAYHFNGETSYIAMGNNESLEVDTAVSISAWFKAKGNGSPSSGGIIANKEGEYSLARFADGSIRWALAFDGIWDNHINTNTIIPLNEPTHVALTYSMTEGKVKIFVNCELVFSENHSSPLGDYTPNQDELRVGARQFLPQFFDGTIDEVKIYNRALTLGEIQENCILTSEVNLELKNNRINIFPNPTDGPLFIENEYFEGQSYTIYNSVGKLIKRGLISDQNFDLVGLNQGIYFISILDKENNLIAIKKIIKLPNRA